MTAGLTLERAPSEQSPCSQDRELLTTLLARAAQGDIDAFMQFYDATSACAYSLALRRGGPETAQELTHTRYLRAWRRAAEHADADLSPLAWLLSLDDGGGR